MDENEWEVIKMRRNETLENFKCLNEHLKRSGILGEVLVFGGAAMVLAFDERRSTKDIYAVFSPCEIVRDAVEKVGSERGLPEGWLNDAVKGFVYAEPEKTSVLELSNIRVWTPTAEYLLSMKLCAARADTQDAEDVKILLRHLNITELKQVEKLLIKYVPEERIAPKSRFFIEEILQEKSDDNEESCKI